MILNAELEPEFVRIHAITDDLVAVDLGGGQTRALPIERCIAILFVDLPSNTRADRNDSGLLSRDIRPDDDAGRLNLADGQRYVGRLIADADLPDNVVAWLHPALGRLEFMLDDVRTMTLPGGQDAASIGRARTEPDLADVVVLRNGDELHGFIISLNDPLTIELAGDDGGGAGRLVELPMERVASVSMITPHRPAAGTRLWLTDGTIMAVQSLTMPESGDLDVTGRWHGSGTQTLNLPRESIAAILTDAERVMPLSSISPIRIEGPPTRYRISDPVRLDQSPLLNVSRIEYRGPLTVHYPLPTDAVHFAAVAELPRESRTLGDFELVIRIDGLEVERRAINAGNPTATINIEVPGSELTIELREGESGPVQNHLILSRAMLLLSK